MINQMADTEQMFSSLLENLDYKSSPYLISNETPGEKIPAELEMTWREAKDKLGIDAIYFVANAPVIYFKRFQAPDRSKLAQLHRNVWSQSKIPLIFAILPTEIRVYSGYEAPHRNKHKGEFTEPSRLENKLVSANQQVSSNVWERLNIFSRTAIESGSFWREYSDSKYFKRTARADQKLIANLRYIRRELVADFSQQMVKYHGLHKDRDRQQIGEASSRYANSLIGRSIFALYLQDRRVLNDENENFFSLRFGSDYRAYIDILASHEHTYNFFQFLQDRFNGDIFPIDENEKRVVRPENLEKLHRLFTEDSVGGKGNRQMLFFWAYNFEFIPIELISSIYEEFLHEEEDGKDGTYYTPPRLVDFVLDQVLPESDTNYELSILDPACGSGIFLVEAYRRLVERWYQVHKQYPSFPELVTILKSSIFGVDKKAEALSVASFSLCLAMSDYLEPKTIWMKVKFPSLIKDGNLVKADFFERSINFAGRKFDLVIGNPPWESQLTEDAQVYLTEHGYDVGDEQIAQAFLWHAPDFCTPQGQIALLCSSKHLLFNRSGPNIAFRQRFFRQFAITQIFDFSALRRFLFEKAMAPTVAIFYKPQSPDPSGTIFYGAPKLTHLTRRFAALVIETNDLKYLPLQQVLENIDALSGESHEYIENDDESINIEQQELFVEEQEEITAQRTTNIWKVALWGTSYDYILLQQLNNYPTLGQVIKEKKWLSKVGFNHKGPGNCNPAPWLDNKPCCTPENFARYGINVNTLHRLPRGDVYYRRGVSQQFQAPLVLFKRTQVQREIGAAYFDQDCAYSETFTCIAGAEEDRNLLKAITALLNSELAQYYLFLTSASWGVEREEIKAGEMRALPFPFFDMTEDQVASIAYLVDKLSSRYGLILDEDRKRTERELNQQIYACFHLNEREKQHIQETIEYTIKFFHRPETYLTQKEPPSLEMKKLYARSYMQSINFYLHMVDRKLVSTVYVQEKTPMLAVKFSLNMLDAEMTDIQEEVANDEMRQVLSNLSKLSIERVLGRMYHRRNFRIYADGDEDTLYMVKPSEVRYWTIAAALSDAEETLADII
jgi:type I restriction-modification system DNA methylase subunit